MAVSGRTRLCAWTQSRQLELKATKSGETYVHFPSTSGEVEKERDLQLTERFQVFSKPFPGEFFQSVLVALGSLLHFTFLIEGEHVKKHARITYRRQLTHQPHE